ncbi:hypothetical protein STENM327S_04215 [Streptomyces tendae]
MIRTGPLRSPSLHGPVLGLSGVAGEHLRALPGAVPAPFPGAPEPAAAAALFSADWRDVTYPALV